jgi:radical SAM superfamily enzyme YgiQ (UPF0313 family)
MKILLLRLDFRPFPVPPPYMPIGILYLASSLEKEGFDVKVIDLNKQTMEDFWKEIIDSDVLGISMLAAVRSQGYNIINEVKKLYPEKKIILGGAFPASIANTLFEKYPIDAIIAGEGEKGIVYLCNEWKNNKKVKQRIYNFDLLDINNIPFPAWHHTKFEWWDMQIAKARPNWTINGVKIGDAKWSPIIASRGCFGRCTFCNAFKHWNYKIRFRTGKNIANEIEELVTKHNVTLFSFDDDAFPINKQQCLELCQEIKNRNLKIAWKADTRIDRMDKEMLEAMKEAGCFMLAVGIESGSPTIIKNIKKNVDLEKAKETIKLIKDVGIIAYTLLMIGNPGETEETIKETIKFLEETKPNIYSYVCGVMVVPGTEMQQLAQIPDEYYAEGDGLPYYTKEHSLSELQHFAIMIDKMLKYY